MELGMLRTWCGFATSMHAYVFGGSPESFIIGFVAWKTFYLS